MTCLFFYSYFSKCFRNGARFSTSQNILSKFKDPHDGNIQIKGMFSYAFALAIHSNRLDFMPDCINSFSDFPSEVLLRI